MIPTVPRLTRIVTDRPVVVILLMLALTGVMVLGMTQLSMDQQADEADLGVETDAAAADAYLEEHYDTGDGTAVAFVYVRADDGTAASRSALVAALEAQRTAIDHPDVTGSLVEDGVQSLPGYVAAELAGDGTGPTDLSIDAQVDVLTSATDTEVAAAIDDLLSTDGTHTALVPTDAAQPADIESHRIAFQLEAAAGSPPSDATAVLYALDVEHDHLELFTLGEHALEAATEVQNTSTMQLVVPIALALVVGILAFAYRDPVDILVGLVGVAVSIIWMFGLLGWLDIPVGMTAIIGPVLIAGLSIDFSFHVFNRYREHRLADRPPRAAMRRGVRTVGIALALVAVTTAIGFLSNLLNPVVMIRDLGIGITLGVIAALVVFLTLVPALKVTAERFLHRVGLDRQRQPLGHGRYLRRVLTSSLVLARRGAPIVLVGALLITAAGAGAWTALDQDTVQQQTEPAPEWLGELPEPLAWDDPAYFADLRYTAEVFAPAATAEGDRQQLLVEGAVTDDGTLQAIASAIDEAAIGTSAAPVEGPHTVIKTVVEEDPAFAETVAAADTSGDGLPDTDLELVFDRLFEAAPAEADRVIERTDGTYTSLRIIGPADRADLLDDPTDSIREAASAIDGEDHLEATAVSGSIILTEQLDTVTEGVVHVLLLALVAVTLALCALFWRAHGRPLVGLVTAVPIAMVVGLVIGGMYLLSVPLTLVTALLMSLVVGLGIDYNIHIADRFIQELDRGHGADVALERTVTGTGGALLGSALTSGAAFLALLIHPHPQLESFGVLVVLALLASFVASVVVLPGLLRLWWVHGGERTEAPTPTGATAQRRLD